MSKTYFGERVTGFIIPAIEKTGFRMIEPGCVCRFDINERPEGLFANVVLPAIARKKEEPKDVSANDNSPDIPTEIRGDGLDDSISRAWAAWESTQKTE